MTNSDSAHAHERMRELLSGYRITQLMIVAAKFGIADALVNGSRSVEDLASAAGVHTQSLYRVLRTLASLGIFRETERRHFELTPRAEFLRSDVEGSIYYAALNYSEPWWWQAWGNMVESVRTGETAFSHLHGMGIFEFMEEHWQASDRFNAHMVLMTDREANLLVDTYDFSAARRVVDVGGGYGALLYAILRRHPHIHGVLFDRPATVTGAVTRFDNAGFSQRYQALGGDFFESVPAEGDIYVLKNVIHDWNDEQALQILSNCRGVMAPHSRLVLIEHIIPAGNEPSLGKIFDMTMLAIVGGAERTQEEYRRLLRDSGLRMSSVVTTANGVGMIEAMTA